jgi:acetylornithine deacetylase/succinyl-diaminopimelate desuccinylase-like protein
MLRLWLLLLALPALSLAQIPAEVKLAQGTFREYLEFLALPNDAINPPDIQRNTDWLEQAFQKRGFTTRQLENKGKPMLFAEWPKKVPGAKTILFYMHLDGQPVVDKEWSQPSPWKPVVKKRNAQGKWEIVDTNLLFQEKLDPDLRVFARPSSDDKAPIIMFLAAFDGLKQAKQEPAFNVKVLLDSEEEKGSPSIPAVVTANKELLKSDAIIIHDGPRHQSDRPTLIFGNRGATRVTLVVFGPKQPLHSGHFGNYVPNPAFRLSRLIASMKDEDGRVTVAGYYDKVKLGDAEKKILADTGDDEAAIKRRTGIRPPSSSAATPGSAPVPFAQRAAWPPPPSAKASTSSRTRPSPSSTCAPRPSHRPSTSSVSSRRTSRNSITS